MARTRPGTHAQQRFPSQQPTAVPPLPVNALGQQRSGMLTRARRGDPTAAQLTAHSLEPTPSLPADQGADNGADSVMSEDAGAEVLLAIGTSQDGRNQATKLMHAENTAGLGSGPAFKQEHQVGSTISTDITTRFFIARIRESTGADAAQATL